MKKLLALLLCVMLLVSVVPTAAFAADDSGINLKPAYDAQYNLYVAYAKLGAATVGKNAVDATGAYAKLFDAVENPNAHARANTWSTRTFVSQTLSKLKAVGVKGTGLSYEGLWNMWGKNINVAYKRIGEGLVIDAAKAERSVGKDALNGAAAELAAVEASITDAIDTMVSGLTF